MGIKGKLFIIGGAEDRGKTTEMADLNIKFKKYELLKELVRAAKNMTVEVVTTSSTVPHEIKKGYLQTFHNMGYKNPGFISIRDKHQASNPKFLSRIETAGAVFFTGGDQFRLSTILGGTPFIHLIQKRYKHDADFLVAGTSAGAMAMSGLMLTGQKVTEALIAKGLELSAGLGLLDNIIVDTHFIKRGRFGRLAHAIIMNPSYLGIGLGEDTGLIIKNGTDAECRGSGMVIIIDGKKMKKSNIIGARRGEPLYAENLKVHILAKGCHFSLRKKKITYPHDEEQ